MTKDELEKKAEMMICTAVGRYEIDDFAQDVIEYLKSQPQVVRCEDCKESRRGWNVGGKPLFCKWYSEHVDYNHYCGHGKKKE